MRIVVEDDAILRTVPVILDPSTSTEYEQALAEFYRHDEPDFVGWRDRLRARIPGLFPAEVVFAKDQEDLREKLRDADGVMVEGLTIGEAELAGAKKLRVVQKFGGIPGNIDVVACLRRSIPVEVQRRRLNVVVAEHAFALMIGLAKNLCGLNGLIEDEKLKAAGYDTTPYDRRYTGNSNFARVTGLKTLNGSTMGILGMGEIGREVASRAHAFGMRIVYHQRRPLAPMDAWSLGALHCSLDEMLAQSDFVSLNVPLNESTRGIIDRAAFAALKPGAIMVNVARAELVARDALIEALDSGKLGGYGLDVGYEEPALPGEKLLSYKNTLLTPHTAVAGRENALIDMEEMYPKMWRALKLDHA